MNTLSALSHSITLFRCSPLAPPFPGSFVLEFIGPDMYKINGVSRTTPFSNSFFAIARTGTNVFTVTPTVFFPAGITIYGGLGVQLASASGCPNSGCGRHPRHRPVSVRPERRHDRRGRRVHTRFRQNHHRDLMEADHTNNHYLLAHQKKAKKCRFTLFLQHLPPCTPETTTTSTPTTCCASRCCFPPLLLLQFPLQFLFLLPQPQRRTRRRRSLAWGIRAAISSVSDPCPSTSNEPHFYFIDAAANAADAHPSVSFFEHFSGTTLTHSRENNFSLETT